MNHRGFTLIEVTVALVVAGMAVSAAAALLAGLGERADEIRAAGARVDRDGNAERLLRDLFDNLRFSGDSSHTLSGDSTSTRFWTWCETVEGWLRPCGARLAVDGTLTLTSNTTATMKLWEGERRPTSIRYLRDPQHGGVWLTDWTDIVPPAAIQLIAGHDTLLFSTW